MIPGSASTEFFGAAGAAGGEYQIARSLRFNAPDTANLTRTPGVAGSLTTWTWAGWVKRAEFGSAVTLFSASDGSSNDFTLNFNSGSFLTVDNIFAGALNGSKASIARFRDTSAWYHVVLNWDTTNATANDRIRLYVNGNRLDVNATTNPTLSATSRINTASLHCVGGYTPGGLAYSGYMADVYFIDGQALDPSSFTTTNATTGQLIPKTYTGGTYGTQGWHLDFSDNSAATATTLGKDSSGNSNNWTPNNFSVTAGVGNDSLVDTPTSYGTDTGVGGSVRGNYCTLNPNSSGDLLTLSNGNLEASITGSLGNGARMITYGTFLPVSGSFYFELTNVTNRYVGIATANSAQRVGVANDGTFFNTSGGSDTGSSVTFSATDIIGVALNVTGSSVTFYKNNTQIFQVTGMTSSYGWFPSGRSLDSAVAGTESWNFGQRAFAYTAPSGFKALCDTNLPTPVVAKPNTVMDVALWTGNGSARSITGLAFNPDFVWIKGRSGATDHALYDAVRGVQIDLVSNSTAAETTQTQGLTAFNSDGFSLGTLAKVNTSSATYAGWAWDAGTSTVTNNSGTISSQVRASASSGFSVVTYTGTLSSAPGTAPTVGHGLGVKPALIISKSRSNNEPWYVNHSYNYNNYLRLNTTAAEQDISASGGGTEADPTSTVFSTYYINGSNTSGTTYVAYCFAPVSGYSSFGSYTGNQNTNGPFVYLGFRPAVVIVKMTSSTGNWTILDSKREGYNVDNDPLFPNLADVEGTTDLIDITSTGFKVRTTNATFNTSAGTYVYAAWAESPFQYARAR